MRKLTGLDLLANPDTWCLNRLISFLPHLQDCLASTLFKMVLSMALFLSALSSGAYAVDNGYVQTPIMGYNTYNDVACSPNATWVVTTLNSMANNGLLSAGYKMFQIDCGWQGFQRSPNGSITYDSDAFPNGISPLSENAHHQGFKWGMYTDEGVYACDTISEHRPGSAGYETQDAAMFAQWKADYVKVDNCWVDANNNAPKSPRTDFVSRYSTMWNALQANNINEMLVCQWGVPYQNPQNQLEGPAQWTGNLSTSFRVSDDIAQGWDNVQRIMNEAIHVSLISGDNAPGHISDMDLLEVGNPGMTVAEQATHFALWATFKSTLMVSTNVPDISSDALAILTNQNLIAINQDPLMLPIKLMQRFTNDNDQFVGNLSNGDLAIMLFDQTNEARSLYVEFSDHGITSADVLDVWTGESQTGVSMYQTNVDAHGSLVIRLSNIVYSAPISQSYTYYDAASGTLAGNANVQSCSGCSSGQKVGYIDQSGSVTISGISTSQEWSDVLFDYVNCDVGYLGDGIYANVRAANVSVNGGSPTEVLFPLTGYDWTQDLITNFRVRLFGFNTQGSNIITITGGKATEYGPDLSRIAVVD